MEAAHSRAWSVLSAAVLIVAASFVFGLVQNAYSSDPLPLGPSSRPVVGSVETPEQLLADQRGGAVVVDSRAHADYVAAHVPGALSVPYDERIDVLETLVSEVPGSTPLIVYCAEGSDPPRDLQGGSRRRGGVTSPCSEAASACGDRPATLRRRELGHDAARGA